MPGWCCLLVGPSCSWLLLGAIISRSFSYRATQPSAAWMNEELIKVVADLLFWLLVMLFAGTEISVSAGAGTPDDLRIRSDLAESRMIFHSGSRGLSFSPHPWDKPVCRTSFRDHWKYGCCCCSCSNGTPRVTMLLGRGFRSRPRIAKGASGVVFCS